MVDKPINFDQSHLLEEDYRPLDFDRKARYRSHRGHECKIIRSTDSTVTLLIYDNPNDPHEWTTSIDNFVKNYVLIS